MSAFLAFIGKLIVAAIYLGVIVYLLALLTRFVRAFERIADTAESVPPRIAAAVEKIADKTEPKA